MTDIIANPEWKAVRILEREEVALGGLGGNMNEQATSLVARTELLMQEKANYADLNAVGAGNRAYKTYADMDADKANIPVNSKVTVTNDELDSNNGDWQWDGIEFTKSIYDPLTQSKKYTDEKTKFVEGFRGVNIANLSDALEGFYISYLNGELDANSEYLATNYYEIDGSVEYRVNENYDYQFAFYDENKVFISGLLRPDANHKFITPSNARYIRMTIYNSPVYTEVFMLAKASEYPAIYTPYSVNLHALAIESNQIKDLFSEVRRDLGVVEVNIVDKDDVLSGMYVNYTSGEIGAVAGYVATQLIEIKPNAEYQTSNFYDQQFAFYDANNGYISGMSSPDANHKFITPSNARYIRFTITDTQLNTLVIAESSLFPNYYVPHSAKIIEGLITDISKMTEILVSADTDDTEAQFTGKNAIQLALDSITDASKNNRYRIVAKGIFKVDQANEYIGYIGYPSMILAKDFVEIVGDGNTIVAAELPYNDADIGLSVNGGNYPRIQYQTLYTYASNALIQGVKFIAKNIRYAIHLDNSGGANKRHDFKDVSFIFKGDKGSQQALGCGTSTGEETYFEGGACHSDVGTPFYCHNNSKFLKPSLMYFKDYTFSSNTSKNAILLQSDGSLVKDKIELIGCSFAGSAYIVRYEELWLKKNTVYEYDSFDHAEWTFTGYGNDPFLFENVVGGESLHFRTNGLGVNNSIRFDKTASAFKELIENTQMNKDVNLYFNGRNYVDGYIVQDGSVGLAAQAFGCKDVSEVSGIYDNGVLYTSLGTRLGNCLSVNKVLVVIVNGTPNTITFNKDYTSMTNAQILSEMNANLIGATVDFYAYGRDYYPMMPDVTEVVFNTTDAPILKGSVVAKSSGSVRLANGSDKVFGVALDDIPVMQTMSEGVKIGEGRVLKRGYIHSNPSKPHFVKANVHVPTIGTKFSVVNGELVNDYVNGTISVDIDTGVVSINC